MKLNRHLILTVAFMATGLTAFAQGKGVWTGTTKTFNKANNADWTQPENQDRLSDSVWITRQNTKGIYNARLESGYSNNHSPEGTLWAFGTTADFESLDFKSWQEATGSNPSSMIDKDMVLFLVHDSIYIDIKFTNWTGGNGGGGFSYERSTDCRAFTNLTIGSAINRFYSHSGKYVWTTSGTYQDTMKTTGGCDSVITYDLTVDSFSLHIDVKNELELTVEATGVNYQWLDCSTGMTPISGATSQTFTPSSKGSYAVEISNQWNKDTSDCIAWTLNLMERVEHQIHVYPNPASDIVYLDLGDQSTSFHRVDLVNMQGQVIDAHSLGLREHDYKP